MCGNASKRYSLTLNNFLHRIDCKATMLALFSEHGCKVKRIRRSRNWLLTGEQDQLLKISTKLQQQKSMWIAKAIDNALPKATISLAEVLRLHPTITVNQLMVETNCTLIEARHAIDVAEALN